MTSETSYNSSHSHYNYAVLTINVPIVLFIDFFWFNAESMKAATVMRLFEDLLNNSQTGRPPEVLI